MTKRRRKKGNLFWRATKATATGLGKGSWWVAKTLGKGIAAGGRAVGKKVKEKKEKKVLEKQPHYKIPSKFALLGVVTEVSGSFAEAEQRLLQESLIVLVFGKRGAGKSALGFRLLENIHAKTSRACYVLGVSQTVLPQWIKSVEDIDTVDNGGVVLVDEGAITFSSRESMGAKNRELGKLMAIARHKDLTLFFITQNTGMLDKNVLKLADTLLIKEGSLLQLEMERPEIKKFYEKSSVAFKQLSGERKKYVYVVDSDFEGVLEVGLPSFWSTKVSKSRA
jgi:hypothetical protein